jgi:hypothetical protein
MFARKGEYSAEILEDWRRHFRSLEKRLPQLHTLDASRDSRVVRIEAIGLIWSRYSARWDTFDRPPPDPNVR